MKLTNGPETFELHQIIYDNSGAAHGEDKNGSGYRRCDLGASCEHEHAPANATVWHDDEFTEELWVA